jgi:uncharacterized membrane protein YfcA
MLAALVLGTLIGVHLLISVDPRWLAAFVGVSFILLAAMLLALPRVRVSPRADRWAAPVVGLRAIRGGCHSRIIAHYVQFFAVKNKSSR